MTYQDGYVSVDAHFARFGSKSYAIDKINSVDVKTETRTGCLWMTFAAIAAVFGLAALGQSVSPNSDNLAFGWGIFLVTAVVAVILYRARPKPLHHLMLATSSGEVQAMNSTDKASIAELRAAIEAAMTAQ